MEDKMQTDVNRYLRVMWDIKWRTQIIGYMDREDHPNRDISLLPPFMKIETIALQIRRVIESIALASLVANEPLYKEEAEKFKKFWMTEKIFEYIEKRNPDFYPKPVTPFLMNKYTGEFSRPIRFIEDGFMMRDMCIEVYKKCNKILHPQNPFDDDKETDYEDFYSQVTDWINLIVKLLDFHIFRLLGSDDFYVVIMHDEILGGDYPTMGRHNLVKLPPEIQEKLRGEGQ